MKRLLVLLLLSALALCGCAAQSAPADTTPVTTESAATAVTQPPETTAATQPPVLEDNLFLKVSSIDFSLVGESDDIYLGLIPREQVTWESDDPSIVSVENGVITATGVGTTTIRATYEDRQVSCTAGCLAQTLEELKALDSEILQKPKRLPPEVDLDTPCTYFDNDAIVGDSITYFLFQWESKSNYLGDILFLARGGVSINGFVRHAKNIYYRGREVHLEDAIAQSQVERVYFLMGSNDVSSKNQRPIVFDNWTTLIQRIREQSPDVELVLMSNIPEYGTDRYTDEKNELIEQYNATLAQFAQENGCIYLDLAYYVQDHYDRMPKIYSQGNYHMNEAGCLNWMRFLRFYAEYESQGGTL